MTVALNRVPGGCMPSVSPGSADPVTAPAPSVWFPLAIAGDRCKGCELCVWACPHHVLVLDDGIVNPLGYHPVRLTDPAGCTSCALCFRVCPDDVFTVFAPRRREA